ncbi:oxidation resistance protein 1 [Rhizina undulata]
MSTSSASYASSISSALSWTFHRLTSDSPQPPQNHNNQGHASTKSQQLSEKVPSRRPSPFAPPPLAPLHLIGHASSTTSHLLSRALAEEIRLLLPARLQLHDTWILAYSLEQHGVSLATLYGRCKKGSFVLIVKDALGGVFGAFVNEALHPSGRYYGTGECFLWKAMILPPSRGGASTADRTDRIRFKAFPYSGINDYMILCDHSYLSIGGGDGKYGLWLDDVFEKGVSSSCLTFGNERLSEEGEKFDIIGVELWKVGS